MLMAEVKKSINGFGDSGEGIRNALDAKVRSEFGLNCHYSRLGMTWNRQNYILFAKKRLMGNYRTYLMTVNMRNNPYVSKPIRISGVMNLENSKKFIQRMIDNLQQPGMFPLNKQPVGCNIPVGKSIIQKDEIPEDVHENIDKYLNRGDEIYCEINVSNVKFYHSGIYAGNEEVYHFLTEPQETETLTKALAIFNGAPARVVKESWYEFIYALIEESDPPPKIYRVTHPLICRSSDEIIAEAEHLQQTMLVYDIRRSNCQHFTSLCSTGVGFSYDMNSNLKYIACTLMKPTHTVVKAITKSSDLRSKASNSYSSSDASIES
ncbi:unnamed protein product [Caenorhabditis angaria]|uniref:LRAT domain-containing protein n=1 Tax=Caenorhabditis angaria TaxID=860376 RepID=A0A9P1MYT5_9PELO|nr:unnamed protein product [Caenorhabditis angaria]